MGKDFLAEILDEKKRIIKAKHDYYNNLKDRLDKTGFSKYGIFKTKISKPGKINLIAEIKKASPSKGLLRKDFDFMRIAQTYCDNGVSAISVLTEEKYFKGNTEYISKIIDNFKLPVLMKDFIIDEGQIYEALTLGASAILLIAAILNEKQIKDFLALAKKIDIDCLLEVHNKEELDKALSCGSEIIGINNRDLKTFEVDLKITEDLVPKIPKDKIIVAESGINTNEDIKRLEKAGVNAVLIGEAFMKADNIDLKIKEIMNNDKS